MSLKNLGLKAKLFGLAGLSAVALITCWFASYSTFELLKVNGPVYNDIVKNKDLLADILPPPAYLLEAHLTVHEMLAERSAADFDELEKKFARLKQEYQTRHQF